MRDLPGWGSLLSLLVIGCGGIDAPCRSSAACALEDAVCVDLGDGIDRCEALCVDDDDCGNRAGCLFEPGSDVGVCWRTCETSQDCAVGSWVCAELVQGSDQGYCLLVLDGSPTSTPEPPPPDTRRLSQLDASAIAELCAATSQRQPRAVTCGETRLDFDWPTTEACIQTWSWPKECEATVSDLDSCYDFIEAGPVDQICDLTFLPCRALNAPECQSTTTGARR